VPVTWCPSADRATSASPRPASGRSLHRVYS
jgi:hypothetical protein